MPLDRCVQWFGANRAAALRKIPVVDDRYREDWVGLSDIGLVRRWRDFQAMPLHINVHQDRVHHQLGRFVLGEDLEPF